MIEIKKHGKKIHTLLKWENIICYNCNCEFSCDNRDTINTKLPGSTYCVYCPDCHSIIKLYDDKAIKLEYIESFEI